MKQIRLTKGKFALVDDDMYEYLNQWKWYAQKTKSGFMAVRTISSYPKKKTIYMHRQILSCPQGKYADHINHNQLDNRILNLRVCTQSQNLANSRLNSNSRSGIKGVSWDKHAKNWRVRIMVNYKEIWLGLFSSKTEAAIAYNKAAKKYFGEFAYEQVA